MNTQTLYQTKYIEKIGKLEQELLKLKKGVGFGFLKSPISLKGILKGINITEKDIQNAKKSLFKQAKI